MKHKINWQIFSGSSHCAEGLASFATGELKSFKAFKNYFLPYMKNVAKEIDAIKNSKIGIKKTRKLARRAFKRICGLSITDAYSL